MMTGCLYRTITTVSNCCELEFLYFAIIWAIYGFPLDETRPGTREVRPSRWFLCSSVRGKREQAWRIESLGPGLSDSTGSMVV